MHDVNIGELAARTGTSARSLRYYEQRGMLEAERTLGGWRDYPESAVDRVTLIRTLLEAGVPTQTIVEIIPCEHLGQPTTEMIDLLETERDRLDANVSDLVRARNRLTAMIQAAQSSRGELTV
ncbi:MerR family transcriptional regulator [Paramicrobacterium agarici]|uniref:MerR family transcriptional regulator n=1 Tax=Paramicrobacterium agarici TaxID=630514 RepID=UPI001B80D463|nr:MerR family transcriptional regulator [Microbacterium agarici]